MVRPHSILRIRSEVSESQTEGKIGFSQKKKSHKVMLLATEKVF